MVTEDQPSLSAFVDIEQARSNPTPARLFRSYLVKTSTAMLSMVVGGPAGDDTPVSFVRFWVPAPVLERALPQLVNKFKRTNPSECYRPSRQLDSVGIPALSSYDMKLIVPP